MISEAQSSNNLMLLSEESVKKYVLPKYNLANSEIQQIKFKNTEKQRAVYKVNYLNESYCLKKVYFNVENLLFVYSAVEWLYRYGINVPRILPTIYNGRFVDFEGMLFILTPWIDGCKLNYDNLDNMFKAMDTLSSLHLYTKKFTPILGSEYIEGFSNLYKSTNKKFKKILNSFNNACNIKDSFSQIFLNHFDANINLAKLSLNASNLINDTNLKSSLCHLDYVNKNLILDNTSDLWIIDFDKCRMDYCVHDISYFLRRYLRREHTNWNFKNTIKILESYEQNQQLNLDEYLYLLSYLSFPQKYWRISRDYYNNIRKCNKKAFQKILIKSVKFEKEQLEFSYNFSNYIEKRFNFNLN